MSTLTSATLRNPFKNTRIAPATEGEQKAVGAPAAADAPIKSCSDVSLSVSCESNYECVKTIYIWVVVKIMAPFWVP